MPWRSGPHCWNTWDTCWAPAACWSARWWRYARTWLSHIAGKPARTKKEESRKEHLMAAVFLVG